MSDFRTPAYCMVCQRQTLHEKQRINNTLHLILSLVTFGAWVLVWITLGIINSSRRPRCTICGSQVTGRQILNEAGFRIHPTSPKPAPYEPEREFAPPVQPQQTEPERPLPPPHAR